MIARRCSRICGRRRAASLASLGVEPVLLDGEVRSRCTVKDGSRYDDTWPCTMTYSNTNKKGDDEKRITFYDDVDKVADAGAPFGIRFNVPVTGDMVENLFTRADAAGSMKHLVAVRCPFNLFERVEDDAVDALERRAVRLVAERAFTMKSRAPGVLTLTMVSSEIPKQASDLPKLVALAFEAVLELEDQIKEGDVPPDIFEGVHWGHRLYDEYDTIMNAIIFDNVMRYVTMSYKDAMWHLSNGSLAHQRWAALYYRAFQVLTDLLIKAVCDIAYREMDELGAFIDKACPVLYNTKDIELKIASILHAAGADILFCQSKIVELSLACARVTRQYARDALHYVAGAPLLYFERADYLTSQHPKRPPLYAGGVTPTAAGPVPTTK